MKLKNQFVTWPDTFERKVMIDESFNELPFCIGYVDGTEIKLAEKPFEDPEAYFSRKSNYCLKLQAVCDKSLKIRHAVIGYPGSVHDVRIYNNCDLATNAESFFEGHQWIAGDSAYRLTSTVLTPFRTNAGGCSAERRNIFNSNFSKYRIRIEHTFALLKERFASLKELRLQLKNDKCIKKACQWILTCIILHNILVEENDATDFDIFNDFIEDADNNCTDDITLGAADITAEMKRNAILNLMKM